MVGILISFYIVITLLLNIPYVQRQLSVLVTHELEALLDTRLRVGRISLGLLNRIVVEDLLVDDRSGKEMLKATRLSVKFDLLPLLKGRISISNIQFFGFNIRLEKATPEAAPNFQFLIDTFASKDTVPKETRLDLRINSLLIRRGRLSYNVLSEAETPGRFNAGHVNLSDIIASISLKALRNDTIHAAVKRMSFKEQSSGFELDRLGLEVIGNDKGMQIAGLRIDLPRTDLQMDTIRMEYDSLAALKDFVHQVRFTCRLQPSTLTLGDLSAFVPALKPFSDPLQLEAEAGGTVDALNCPLLSISSGDHFVLQGDVSFQDLSSGGDAYVFGNLSRLYADPEGVAFFVRNLSSHYTGVPPVLQRLGTISFRGELSGYFTDLVTYGNIRTNLGVIRTDIKLSSYTEADRHILSYSGDMKTSGFQLGRLTGNAKLGNITFNVKLDGRHAANTYPAITAKGLISSIDYSGYTYENITLDGEYRHGGFTGGVRLEDENASLALNGTINAVSKVPTFNFLASVNHIRPHALHLTKKYEGAEFSVRLKADFTGGSIDEMDGEINIDSLEYTSPENSYFLDNLKLVASRSDDHRKRLDFISPFLRGNIEGDYSYRTLPASFLNILRRYLPAVLPASGKKEKLPETANNFGFDFHIYDTELLSKVFGIPLTVYTHSTLKGYFNDKLGRIRMEGYFPHLRYGNKFIESGLLLCENPSDCFHARVRFTNRHADDAVNVSLEARAQNDSLQTVLNWGNNGIVTYSGQLSATTRFMRHQLEEATGKTVSRRRRKAPASVPALKTVVDIHPTDVILNDTLWNIRPSQVVLDSGRVYIHDFQFTNRRRYLHADGIVSDRPQDTVRLDLQQINIGYVFDIANLGVNFQGEATGPAYASGVLGTPVMSTDLFIHNLGINDGLLGDADIHGEWHHDVKGIYLDARIREADIARTRVHGFIYPIKPTSSLDLQIDADSTNLQFIHYYMQSITPQFSGRATGHVHFYGKFKALTMEGRVYGDASMKVDVLNTTFSVRDSIYIAPDGLTFRNNRLYDTQGHQGTMSGYLHYNHFKDLNYRFNFDVSNMLLLNTRESADFPFYGTVYGTGTASIAGNAADGVNINVAMSTGRNSNFTYIKDNVTSAVSNQFIRFVDKTPRRAVQDSVLVSIYERARREMAAEEEQRSSDTDIRLNLIVDATPDATMRIIMDPVAGDYISGRGSGNIRTEFYNKGDVKLFGNYTINQGVYKFSLQEVIRKDFVIRSGSSITFNGEPLNATLDIHANYTVNSASLNDLIPNASSFVDQTNVKVNCVMDLTGQLTSPNIKLDLELPNERDEVEALVRNYIPTDEQMNMQILYLLGIGKFYPSETFGTGQNSDMMSSVLSSTLSGQLNNALSQIIDNNNWNVGTNFSTGEKGWTDMEFEGMLSGQLLNNRLLINGNFGYRDNPLANTNFVGDFEAEWLVNRSGDIRLKAYNETNDRYYTRTNLTTQGIGIIFRKDFDKWNDLFFWKKWKLFRLKQLRPRQDAQPAVPDTTSTR